MNMSFGYERCICHLVTDTAFISRAAFVNMQTKLGQEDILMLLR